MHRGDYLVCLVEPWGGFQMTKILNRLSAQAILTALAVFLAPSASRLMAADSKAASSVAWDTVVRKPCSFFPPNNLRFPIRPNGQMNEMTFNKILQALQQVYAPLVARAGHPPLVMFSQWKNDEVNAFAQICNQPELLGTPGYPEECRRMLPVVGQNTLRPLSIVVLYGGLARHPLMTPEGLILVGCHELGHHIGGFPRYEANKDWAATEGQSDYFATTKCARKVFAALGQNEQWAAHAQVPFEIRTQCNASFPNSPEQSAICMRSAAGGLSLARVLGSGRGQDPRSIDFRFASKTVVPVTFESHPEAQCRLDTYFAGAICQVSENEPFSLTDARPGACHESRLQNRGARPRCWFGGGIASLLTLRPAGFR